MSAAVPVRRVLLTADAVGGVWTYTLELAAGLGERGIETVLAVLGPPPDASQRAAAERISALSLVTTGLDLEWRDRLGLADPAAAAHLRALARDAAVDLVHCNGFREAAYGFGVPVVLAAHSCVLSWWRACRGGDAPAEWDAYGKAVRAGLRSADMVVAPSAAYLAALQEHYGPLPDARVIHNGRAVRPAADTARRPVVLSAGRLWDEAKNLQALVAVAPALPWPVELAGDLGENENTGAVTCLGRLPAEALLARMGEAEIFCSPARYEPFGLAALEAGMQGAALVLGDIPSQREIWGDAALFVPPDDTAALEVALLRLIRDPDERRQLQAAARARAARYTRERMTEAYLALYGRIARRPAEAA